MLDPVPAMELPPDLLARVAWITPNETEVVSLTGQVPTTSAVDQYTETAQMLIGMGARG